MYMAQTSCQVELRDQLATRQDLRSALGWGSTKDIVGDGDNRDMGKVVSIFTDTNINIYIYIIYLTNHVIHIFWVLLFAFPLFHIADSV